MTPPAAGVVSRVPSGRWRRWGVVLVLLVPACGAAAADLPELDAALREFRADVPRGWSYLQTTSAAGKTTVERYDATRPEFDRWSLLLSDGRAPTEEERRRYFENRSRRSRGGTAPRLAEQLDLATTEPAAQDGTRTTYRGRLRTGESGDKTSRHLIATIVVHRSSGTIELVELRSSGEFSPALGVRIAELCTRMTYSIPADGTPSLPVSVETRVRGTAFWFKSLDAELTVRFSEFSRATRP